MRLQKFYVWFALAPTDAQNIAALCADAGLGCQVVPENLHLSLLSTLQDPGLPDVDGVFETRVTNVAAGGGMPRKISLQIDAADRDWWQGAFDAIPAEAGLNVAHLRRQIPHVTLANARVKDTEDCLGSLRDKFIGNKLTFVARRAVFGQALRLSA